MPDRVSPTERVRGYIDELFASGKQLPEILEEVARLGAQLLMQAALQAEITEFLGRDRYQRAADCEHARPGFRNGYREVTDPVGRAHQTTPLGLKVRTYQMSQSGYLGRSIATCCSAHSVTTRL